MVGRVGVDGVSERADQRCAAVDSVVLVHALRDERVSPGRDSGLDGQSGGLPGRSVVEASPLPRAGGHVMRCSDTSLLHHLHGAAQPVAASTRGDQRPGTGGKYDVREIKLRKQKKYIHTLNVQ